MEWLFFLAFLFITKCKFVYAECRWEAHSDLRQVVGVWNTTVLPRVYCAAVCYSFAKNCYGFNYNPATETCEVLGVSESSLVLMAPEAAENWTLYVREDFARSPCSFPVCKIGSLCLLFPDRFEPDYNEVPPSVWLRYTCSSHSYLIDKQQAGNPNCRFVQLENSAMYGFTIPPYNPSRDNYAVVLGHCDDAPDNPCLSLESKPDGSQYLKFANHFTQSTHSVQTYRGYAFFYADCFP